MKKNLVVILAGGSGLRLNKKIPKQFLEIAGKTIIEYPVERFETHPEINDIFIVTNPEYYKKTKTIVQKNGYKKVRKILKGGKTRQESSKIGVIAGRNNYKNVLIHDAVRPFVSSSLVDELLRMLKHHEAIGVATPVSDTIIKVNREKLVEQIPDRSKLMFIQTPQAFRLDLIQNAHNKAIEAGIFDATDDCSLILKFNLSPIFILDTCELNIKVTYPVDLLIAEEILEHQKG